MKNGAGPSANAPTNAGSYSVAAILLGDSNYFGARRGSDPQPGTTDHRLIKGKAEAEDEMLDARCWKSGSWPRKCAQGAKSFGGFQVQIRINERTDVPLLLAISRHAHHVQRSVIFTNTIAHSLALTLSDSVAAPVSWLTLKPGLCDRSSGVKRNVVRKRGLAGTFMPPQLARGGRPFAKQIALGPEVDGVPRLVAGIPVIKVVVMLVPIKCRVL